MRSGKSPAATLVVFFVLTYAMTWTCFLAAAAITPNGTAPHGTGMLLLMTGIFAPSIVAISLSAREGGNASVVALLRRLIEWRVAWRWYAFAVLYMAAIKIVAAVLHRVATGNWPRFGSEGFVTMAAATVISVLVGGQAGEEIGWRGYALPRIASRLGFGWASVIVGVLWACWHLPLFFVLGGDTAGQSFPVYLIQVTALSVAIAWLYVQTKGSLLLTMLMHSAFNNTKDIVPSARPGATNPLSFEATTMAWLTVALLWMCATFFLVRMKNVRASGETAGVEVARV